MEQNTFIDTHAHLTYDNFQNNLKQQLTDWQENYFVNKVFTVGYDLASSKLGVQLAEAHKNVYTIVGVHPSDIATLTQEVLQQLNELCKHPKVVAVGEIGLDYHYTQDNKEQQKQGFVAQLKLAHDNQLPIAIHTRDASSDLLEVLQQNKHLLTYGGLVHCFSEDYEFYKQIEPLGLNIALGGSLTFKNATTLQEAVKQIPLTSIVLETDAPYLTPVPFRGKEQNAPKFVPLVAQKLAELKQVSLSEVANTTNQNVYRIFKKAKG